MKTHDGVFPYKLILQNMLGFGASQSLQSLLEFDPASPCSLADLRADNISAVTELVTQFRTGFGGEKQGDGGSDQATHDDTDEKTDCASHFNFS
jgi:hypothetical protein